MSWPYAQIKTAVTGDILAATDYNNEHQNHITNNDPSSINDSSATTVAMQATTSPGGVGSESLAVTLDGEIQRLRYVLKTMHAGAQWYPGQALLPLTGGTLTGALTINPATNQLVLGGTGAGRTVTITAPQPAVASRTLTIPDMGANSKFLMSAVSLVDNAQVNAAGYFIGTVVQTVQVTDSTNVTSSGTAYTSTATAAAITPKATTHKVKISVTGSMENKASAASVASVSIFRGATDLSGGASFVQSFSGSALDLVDPCSIVFLDSPASTSALTYTVKVKSSVAADTVWNPNSNLAVILLEEIAF